MDLFLGSPVAFSVMTKPIGSVCNIVGDELAKNRPPAHVMEWARRMDKRD